jgi:hypothetical protein
MTEGDLLIKESNDRHSQVIFTSDVHEDEEELEHSSSKKNAERKSKIIAYTNNLDERNE